MTTEIDKHGIYHIDGPPVGGFAIVENPDGSGARVDVIYYALGYYGTKDECEEAYDSLMNLIISELKERTLNQPNMYPSIKPIIWWRHRKEITREFVEDRHKLYCRLATTPPLPNDFWDRWAKKENEPFKRAREVVG